MSNGLIVEAPKVFLPGLNAAILTEAAMMILWKQRNVSAYFPLHFLLLLFLPSSPIPFAYEQLKKWKARTNKKMLLKILLLHRQGRPEKPPLKERFLPRLLGQFSARLPNEEVWEQPVWSLFLSLIYSTVTDRSTTSLRRPSSPRPVFFFLAFHLRRGITLRVNNVNFFLLPLFFCRCKVKGESWVKIWDGGV